MCFNVYYNLDHKGISFLFIVNFGPIAWAFKPLLRGDFCMLNHGSKKNGYTLVEVLVVVTIMGILSSMGVAGLRGAVINSRMKDCALNTTAFLERIANESNRLSKRLCVVKDNDHRLTAYVTETCGDLSDAEEFDTFTIESPAKFGCEGPTAIDDFNDYNGVDWTENGALFEPRIGLAATPTEGYICMQYGSSEIYGLAFKRKTNNMIIPMWKSGSIWDKL